MKSFFFFKCLCILVKTLWIKQTKVDKGNFAADNKYINFFLKDMSRNLSFLLSFIYNRWKNCNRIFFLLQDFNGFTRFYIMSACPCVCPLLYNQKVIKLCMELNPSWICFLVWTAGFSWNWLYSLRRQRCDGDFCAIFSIFHSCVVRGIFSFKLRYGVK